MGILIMLILALFFGAAFSSHHQQTINKLTLELSEKEKEIVKLKEQHQYEKKVLQNTIRELM